MRKFQLAGILKRHDLCKRRDEERYGVQRRRLPRCRPAGEDAGLGVLDRKPEEGDTERREGVPLDEICWRDRLLAELAYRERRTVGGHLRPERHLYTRSVGHRGIQHRFCDRYVFAGPLRKLRDERVQFGGVMVGEARPHRFVCRMVNKDRAVHAVAGYILDILVVHHRIDQPVAEELFLNVVEDLLPFRRKKVDTVVGDDGVCRFPERFFRRITVEVAGGDVERLKEALLDLYEEFLFAGRESGLDDTVGVLVGCAIVDHPDVGVRLVHRVELDLLHPRRRPHGEIDERSMECRVVLLDNLPDRRMELLKEPESGLRLRFRRDRDLGHGKRGG